MASILKSDANNTTNEKGVATTTSVVASKSRLFCGRDDEAQRQCLLCKKTHWGGGGMCAQAYFSLSFVDISEWRVVEA